MSKALLSELGRLSSIYGTFELERAFKEFFSDDLPENAETIMIRDNHLARDVKVKAVVCGPLAAHRALGCGDWWSVTHIPTGWLVANFLTTKAQALQIAEALKGGDWDFTDPKDPKVKAMGQPVRDAVYAARNEK